MSTLLTNTPGLESGIDVINRADSQKFPLILNRICQCIQTKSDNLRPFSEDEEEKLLATFSFKKSELRLMLDCSTLIMKQATFNVTKPALLHQQLSDQLKLNEDKVEAFVSTWTSQAKNTVSALKHKSTHPMQVKGVSWQLSTTVSSSDSGPRLEPRASIELRADDDSLRLELGATQLCALYQILENIQTRLDGLR